MLSPRTLLAFTLLLAAIGCGRSPARPARRTNNAAPSTATAAPAAATADVPQAAPPPMASSMQDFNGPEFMLHVGLMPAGSRVPGRLQVEFQGAGEYHVNEQYPVAVQFTIQHGTAEKTALTRTDAAEYTRTVARFDVPLRPEGPGPTMEVRGSVRFSVCRAEQCTTFTREFLVGTP